MRIQVPQRDNGYNEFFFYIAPGFIALEMLRDIYESSDSRNYEHPGQDHRCITARCQLC